LNKDIYTAEYVRECFEYIDGKLFWKHRPLHHFTSESNQKRFNSVWVGKEAGYINKRTDSKRQGFSYHRVRLWGKLQKTHRVIFMMFHNYMPEMIDHIDNNPLNNRIENLRESDVVRNAANSLPNYNKKTKGVQLDKDRLKFKYKVNVATKQKTHFVGHFETEQEAQAAYNLACLQLNIPHFKPVKVDFKGHVRETNFFKVNNFSTYYE